MFKFGSLKEKTGVGLNIGSSSVSVVELVKKNERFFLLHFGVEPIKNTEDRTDLAEVIKKVIGDAGITSKEINSSVAGQEVIVRYIGLPQMTKEELDGAIKFEAEKYIPFNIDEVVLDCQILDKKPQSKMNVLLVAAKKSLIDNHINLIKQAGLTPVLIDVDSFAIINAFQMANPEQVTGTITLLNLGAQFSSINILKDNISCFTRDVLIGGNNISKAISEKLNVGLEEADRLKCNPEGRKEEISEIAKPVVENLLSEIQLSFDYYESQFEKGIDKAFVSGRASNFVGLVDTLKESLKLEITAWDPLKGLQISPGINREELSAVSNRLAVAIGLALRKG